MNRLLIAAAACLAPAAALAGPFDATGIALDDPRIERWATTVVGPVVRGPIDISTPGSPLASFGTAAEAIGPASTDPTAVVSLGDGGSITVGFSAPIFDTPGPDFAVFENSFEFDGQVFAELGFVEVSTNGVDFFRFDAVSLTQTTTQLGPFDGIDPTDVQNLAGNQPAGVGTLFDLAELAGASPLLDVSNVNFVRIVDVVGSIDPQFGSLDSAGTLINDPFPTDFASGSGGFDLDAVAVLRPVPEPAAGLLAAVGVVCGFGARRARRRTA
ncbi:MAG: PEP-CTERM sorting domain-containing protein [Planctomycetota bacterium]